MVTTPESVKEVHCWRPMCPTCYPVNLKEEAPAPPTEPEEEHSVRSGTKAQQAAAAIFAATGVRVNLEGADDDTPR